MASLADCNREISELMIILKKEIKMLRVGNFQNIHQASLQKSERTKLLAANIAQLELGNKLDSNAYRQFLIPRLAQLKSLSRENGLLLRSVLRGVKSAGERIYSFKNQEANVGAYGRQGKALSFEEQPMSKEKTF